MTRYRVADGLRAVAAGDALVVVDPATGAAHVLDAAGAALVDRLDRWVTADDLAETYAPDPDGGLGVDELARQVADALEGLAAIRVVERR